MAKYKIEYDEDICIGTLNCIAEAEEHFAEDEKGYTILQKATKNEKTSRWS